MRRQPERAIQAAGVKLLRSMGEVWVLGTTRRRGDHPGTMQTPGIPDVKAFLRHPTTEQTRHGLWWEAKAPGGRLSVEQERFRACALAAGEAHVVGDLDALIARLVAYGYLRSDQVAHYHTEGRT
jgi:hypothetical protein